MNEQQVRGLVLFLEAGIRVLSARIVLVVALLLSFGLFCWVIYDPSNLRLAAATIFTVLVFLPTVRVDMRQDREVVKGE
jgi:hypothetical protein